MDGAAAAGADAHAKLLEHGYVVLEGLISADEVARLRASLEAPMARERAEPFDPGDGPAYMRGRTSMSRAWPDIGAAACR